jgi:tetratricopeptide (TPR) repeat protein
VQWPAADERFGASPALPDEASLLALDGPMRRYLSERLRSQRRPDSSIHARANALLRALYQRSELQLDYDDRVTRTPQQAFAARRGNCLSLVLMTAAFAREMDLQVGFNEVTLDEPWQAEGGLLLRTGHINLTLMAQAQRGHLHGVAHTTVDFLPGIDLSRLPSHRVSSARVMAMFFNNRAAEALVDRRLDLAYWLARESLGHDARFAAAGNTLGVVMLRAGLLPQAAQAFEQALALSGDDAGAMSNLAQVRAAQGLHRQALALRQRAMKLDARAATAADAARAQLGRSAGSADDPDPAGATARRWLHDAVVALRDGDWALAERRIGQALASAPEAERPRYGGKLERLRRHREALPTPQPDPDGPV